MGTVAGSLMELAEGVQLIPGPVNLGLVEGEGGLLAIDGGLNEDAVERLVEGAAALALPITRLFVTHAHADHVGGAALLRKRTGCRVIVPAVEAPLAMETWLNPTHLVGGAPFPEIRGSFLQAKPCPPDGLAVEGPFPGLPQVTIVPLPGHSPGMCGLKVADVLFCADALFPTEVIAKHRLLYHWHARVHLRTLDRLEAMHPALRLVPAHGVAPLEDVVAALEANRAHLLEVEGIVAGLLAEPRSREEVTALLCARLGLQDNPTVWALAHGTVQGYLTGLRENGRATVEVRGGRLLWKGAGV